MASSTLRRAGLWFPTIEQLVGGRELEEVPPHEPGAEPVAPGELLNLGLGQAAPLLGLGGDGQTAAPEVGHVGRVLLPAS